MSTTSIETDVRDWDGKSTEVVAAVFLQEGDDPRFADSLIALLAEPACQRGASWLLKAWFQEGNQLDDRQTSSIVDVLGELEHWEATLHVLQCLPFLTIHDVHAKQVESFLRAGLAAKNKFVRAWAYGGFHELARQHPVYRDEAIRLLDVAARDEAPSVKARIRNVVRRGW